MKPPARYLVTCWACRMLRTEASAKEAKGTAALHRMAKRHRSAEMIEIYRVSEINDFGEESEG